MGLLNLFKRIFKKNANQLLLDAGKPLYGRHNPIEVYGVCIPVFDSEEETLQFKSPRITGKKFKNYDGEKTNVYIANVVKYNSEGYTNDLKGKMISFELAETLSIQDAIDDGLIAILLNRPKAFLESLDRAKVNHLGRINAYGSILDSHAEVESWVNDNLTKELKAKIEASEKTIKDKHKKVADEQVKVVKEIEEVVTEEPEEKVSKVKNRKDKDREERIKNPSFIRELDGSFIVTNVNNGNDIDLTIQNIELVTHANGIQEYYYSAFKQETKPGKPCKCNPDGVNFEFSLPAEFDLERLFQMANDESNPDYAKSIITMIAEVMSKEPAHNMNLWNYAGGIDLKDGNFEYKDMGVEAHKTVGRLLQTRQERAAAQYVNESSMDAEVEERVS